MPVFEIMSSSGIPEQLCVSYLLFLLLLLLFQTSAGIMSPYENVLYLWELEIAQP